MHTRTGPQQWRSSTERLPPSADEAIEPAYRRGPAMARQHAVPRTTRDTADANSAQAVTAETIGDISESYAVGSSRGRKRGQRYR